MNYRILLSDFCILAIICIICSVLLTYAKF